MVSALLLRYLHIVSKHEELQRLKTCWKYVTRSGACAHCMNHNASMVSQMKYCNFFQQHTAHIAKIGNHLFEKT